MSVASNFTSHIIALLCCVCASLFPRLCLCGPCIQGVEFWAVNTDAQALANHSATNKVQIGSELTRGLGCGGAPELGAQAAIESHDELRQMLQAMGVPLVKCCRLCGELVPAHSACPWWTVGLEDCEEGTSQP
eukprot:scaffold295784_cov23-Tisochrysis_lutea.AAC.1